MHNDKQQICERGDNNIQSASVIAGQRSTRREGRSFTTSQPATTTNHIVIIINLLWTHCVSCQQQPQQQQQNQNKHVGTQCVPPHYPSGGAGLKASRCELYLSIYLSITDTTHSLPFLSPHLSPARRFNRREPIKLECA